MGAQTWIAILDDMESRIDAAELALDQELAIEMEPFDPPTDLAPLPESMRDRAIHVLRRQTELEQRIENLKRSISTDITAALRSTSPVTRFSEAATPSYFDSRA